VIIAAGYDKLPLAIRAQVSASSSAKRRSLIGRQTRPTAALTRATAARSRARIVRQVKSRPMGLEKQPNWGDLRALI
jgi:hypothetical protein